MSLLSSSQLSSTGTRNANAVGSGGGGSHVNIGQLVLLGKPTGPTVTCRGVGKKMLDTHWCCRLRINTLCHQASPEKTLKPHHAGRVVQIIRGRQNVGGEMGFLKIQFILVWQRM